MVLYNGGDIQPRNLFRRPSWSTSPQSTSPGHYFCKLTLTCFVLQIQSRGQRTAYSGAAEGICSCGTCSGEASRNHTLKVAVVFHGSGLLQYHRESMCLNCWLSSSINFFIMKSCQLPKAVNCLHCSFHCTRPATFWRSP